MYNLTNEIIESVNNETTFQSNISYLPGGFSGIESTLKVLARMKKVWNIKVLEGDKNIKLNFEDKLFISVPRQYMDRFLSEIFSKPTPTSIPNNIDLSLLLESSKSFDETWVELSKGLDSLLNSNLFMRLNMHCLSFLKIFGRVRYITPVGILFRFESLNKSLYILKGKLMRVYKDDIGSVEMLINALKNKTLLGGFKIFNRADYLAGSTIFANYLGVKLRFECYINLNFVESERLIIDDPDVLGKLMEYPFVKVVKNVVYPIGRTFKSNFFRDVLYIIK